MNKFGQYGDLEVSLTDGRVAICEIQRPPHNFFDIDLIEAIADAYEALDKTDDCRAIVLCAAGKHFCAGANFGNSGNTGGARDASSGDSSGHLYSRAVRMFRANTPVVAAVHGAAIGGGLGLAVSADFRVACPEARFSANFTRLGFHPGFGLTTTLPEVIGKQRATLMFYTGRRLRGDEAYEWGLADVLVAQDQVRSTAIELATEMAESAPLAVVATRQTMRGDLADRVKAATDHELVEQNRLKDTNDWSEGVKAMAERRTPNFTGT
ncbi:MAG: enoyl-CoA hydratase/isomerase family protein [Gammaproteobacteria bacterium]|nr:enoyl-CoA hydratase/isomerase family protein [Gammaproteobacteria bacterium]